MGPRRQSEGQMVYILSSVTATAHTYAITAVQGTDSKIQEQM
jgi:hypothetical protein